MARADRINALLHKARHSPRNPNALTALGRAEALVHSDSNCLVCVFTTTGAGALYIHIKYRLAPAIEGSDRMLAFLRESAQSLSHLILEWHKRREFLEELNSLDDVSLAELGLTRRDIPYDTAERIE
jgi:uncharacterized protein YjiS (DUF1127 family)